MTVLLLAYENEDDSLKELNVIEVDGVGVDTVVKQVLLHWV